MTDQLEHDLRDAFATRAAEVPGDSALRLGAVEFHPRTRRMPRRFVVGSLSGLAATGAIVPALVLGGTQPAFAGWTATPTAATAPATPASTSCLARLAELQVPGGGAVGQWSPVATDVRGPYTFVVYADGPAFATCFTGASFSVVSAATAGTETGNGVVTVTGGSSVGPGAEDSTKGSATVEVPSSGSAGAVERAVVSHFDLSTADGGAYTMVEGQGSSDLTSVTLVRSDGSTVQATVDDGWFVAWWPGDLGLTSASVSTSGGQGTVTFQANPLPDAPSTGSSSCTADATGGGTNTAVHCTGNGAQG